MIRKNPPFLMILKNQLTLNFLKILKILYFPNCPSFQLNRMCQLILNFLSIRNYLLIHQVQMTLLILTCLQIQMIPLLPKIQKFRMILKTQRYLIVLMNQQYHYFLQSLTKRYHCTYKYCYPLNCK
jgi:hypothetical protein